MGPLLLGRMLNLNETQLGVLNLVFKIADDNGLLLLDLKDLRAMLQYVGDNAKEFTTEYGNISAASVGAIQRGLLQIEQQGGDKFFGEPMLNIQDFMQTVDGQGVVNILAADKLMNSPRLYATFLLWMLSELFEPARNWRPRKAQAGVLLRRGPPAVQRGAQGAHRAHRAGGAPGALQGRGRVFRHAEPARHPRQRAGPAGQPRAARAARLHAARPEGREGHGHHHAPKPGLDIETAITELAVGEALVSFLDAKGRPSVTERVYVLPPGSQIGPITPQQRRNRWRATKKWWTGNRPTKSSAGTGVYASGGPRIGLRWEAQGRRSALGYVPEHSPAQVLGKKAHYNDGLRRTWYWACCDESIDPRNPSRLPLLFAIDTKLDMPDGLRYAARPPAGPLASTAQAFHYGTSFSEGGFSGRAEDFAGVEPQRKFSSLWKGRQEADGVAWGDSDHGDGSSADGSGAD
jgi:hypothetical protein